MSDKKTESDGSVLWGAEGLVLVDATTSPWWDVNPGMVTVATIDQDAQGGSIALLLPDGTESIRIEPDGKFFVRGKEVAEDVEVYEAMKRFLSAFGCG